MIIMMPASPKYRVLLTWILSAFWIHTSFSFAPTNKSPDRTSSRGHPLSPVESGRSGGENSPGKILVLGGTGFLGQAVCKRALAEGFQVTSLSRRGLPPRLASEDDDGPPLSTTFEIDYRQGDARIETSVSNILSEGGYTGIVHCIGLLLDETSGLSLLNQLVSGSRSIPDANSTYDTITRLTAFNAIDMATEYAASNQLDDFAFCFTSAAEAGWPEVPGGDFVGGILPDFMKRYLVAKRAVEAKLNESAPVLRPIIVRPSLIYSMDRPQSFVSVGAFFAGNTIGLPFIDKPVTVQALALTIVKALKDKRLSGVLRYPEIERIGGSS